MHCLANMRVWEFFTAQVTEKDVVNYESKNLKGNVGLYYRL